jgi:hypothetical protein
MRNAFDQLPDPCLGRENILQTIEQMLEANDVAILEGPEGRGKTVTAELFAQRHRTDIIAIFLKSGSRWAYEPGSVCSELSWQIAELLGRTLDSDNPASMQTYEALLYKLRRYLITKQKHVMFIVDGVSEIPLADTQYAKQIWDLLPFDVPGCKFLITKDDKSKHTLAVPKATKATILPLLGPEEASQYFDGLGLDKLVTDQLQRTCRGQPSMLATVRRLVKFGITPDAIYEHLTDELSDLFQVEWTNSCGVDDITKRILATVAYDGRENSIADVARLLNLSESQIRAKLATTPFIAVHDTTNAITFVSEPYRRFASKQLVSLRSEIEDVVIKDLLNRQSQDPVAAILPGYLHNAGRLGELLTFLTPDNVERTMHHSQSLTPMKQQVDYGVRASLALHKDGDLVRFSIHRSAIIQLESTDVWKSEVEARIALNDFETAHALANAARLKEDRLHLLAVIAKEQIKRAMPIEPELAGSIAALFEQIDCLHLGKRAMVIASDLIYAAPALAIEMVEQSSKAESEEDTDIAIATLALAAPRAAQSSEGDDFAKELQARIRSPELKAFIEEANVKISNTSAKEIAVQVQQIRSPERKLFFLRRWAVQNRERADASEVVEAFLAIAIRATEYTPNARHMRELATPLPYIENEGRLQHLVGLFTANKGSIERYGPTIDYVRFLLLLARGEYRHSLERGRRWFEEAYLQSLAITDLAIRAECYAWLIVDLTFADSEQRLEASDELHTLAANGLRETVSELHATSALQEVVFAGILRALASARIDLAGGIARSLNTESRRDKALAQVAEAIFDGDLMPGTIREARGVLNEIVDQTIRANALCKGISKLGGRADPQNESYQDLLQIFEMVRAVGDPVKRCEALTQLYYTFGQMDVALDGPVITAIYNAIVIALSEVDVAWEKVRITFAAVALLARTSPLRAQELLVIAEQAKDCAFLQTGNAAAAYIGTILLAIGAYAGLLPRSLADDDDVTRLGELIDRIPSDGERARMWAEMALRAHTAEKQDLCQKIVKERVRPLIENVQRQNGWVGSQIISRVAPALYVAHPTSAKEDLKSLTPQVRELAYANVCSFLLGGRTSFEPFETITNQCYEIDYAKALDILEIAGQLDRDDSAYHFLHALVNSLAAAKNTRITVDQLNLIIAKLESIAKTKFPNPRFITHQGYAICTQALILKLKKAKAIEFDNLVIEARTLPNKSDLVFVMCMLSAAHRDRSKSRSLLVEAYEQTHLIACIYDRGSRIRTIATEAVDVDSQLAKKMLQSGMQIAVDSDSEGIEHLQRNMLDCAYRIDPDYAAMLVALADKDPARMHMRGALQSRLDILNTTKALAEKSKSRQKFKDDKEDYPQVAWRLIGKLNAGRIASKSQEDMREYVRIAADMPVSDAYPILAWVIGNAVNRFAKTDQAASIIRPMFEATLLASRIAGRMADHNSRVLKAAFVGERVGLGSANLIRAGEREVALSRIRVWIEEKVGDYLTICDPFFGPEDLDVLKLVLAIKPGVQVRIVTSLKHQAQLKVQQPYEDTYRNIWRTKIADQDPPDTEITFVGMQSSNESPIHDRWWLSNDSGLRLGTSLRSLGVGKDAELSELAAESVAIFEAIVNRLIRRETREYNGEKLKFVSFTLY